MTPDEVRRREREQSSEMLGTALGVLGAIGLSLALVPLRDHLQSADFALALVIPVLLSALVGGRWAGATTAVVAALCFDFFFTRPYQSLRITDSNDVTSFLVLLVVAMIAAEVSIRARRGGEAAKLSREELDRVYRVVEVSAAGATVDEVIDIACDELTALLGLRECTFEREIRPIARPWLGRRGALEGAELTILNGGVKLPVGGVELPVIGRGHEYGRLVLFAPPNTSASAERRMVAVAIADELGLTLAAGEAQPT